MEPMPRPNTLEEKRVPDSQEESIQDVTEQVVDEKSFDSGNDGGESVVEEEEEEECGFCLYMKGGPCKESFIKWEECVEQAEKLKEDIVAKCHKVTFVLKECMEQNSDYYGPVLKAEKEMDEQAVLQEERQEPTVSGENFGVNSERESHQTASKQDAGDSEKGNVGGHVENKSQMNGQTVEEALKQVPLEEHKMVAEEGGLELKRQTQDGGQDGVNHDKKRV